MLIPGVTAGTSIGFNGMGAQDVGGAGGDQVVQLSAHGGRTSDQRITQNGVAVGSLYTPDTDMTFTPNLGATQEVTIDTSGVSAEAAEGGVRINLIPKEGGNTIKGSFFGSFANGSMQANNLTDDLKARGLTIANSIKKVADINPAFGGPIKKDTLWFFTSFRSQMADNYVGGMFFDPDYATPGSFVINLDKNHRVSDDAVWNLGEGRLTWQVNSKNKIGIAFTKEHQCKCPEFIQRDEVAGGRRAVGLAATF